MAAKTGRNGGVGQYYSVSVLELSQNSFRKDIIPKVIYYVFAGVRQNFVHFVA